MQFLVYVLYRGLLGLFGWLPIRLVYAVGWLLGRFGYVVAVPYRRLALHNLKIAFPEKTEAERRAIAREHFGRLVANILCGVRVGTLPDDAIAGVAELENDAVFTRLIAENRGMVLALAHLSNWEIITRLPTRFYPPGRNSTIYQSIRNSYIDEHTRKLRSRHGLTLFNRNDGFNAPMALVRAGGAVGILVDQHAGDGGVWVPFFNRLASTTTLAALLAGRTRGAIVPCAVYTIGPARWRMVVSEPIEAAPHEGVASWTARLNTALEKMIRQSPADWFWVHNRWKTPKPKFLLADYKRGVTLPAGMKPEDLQPFRILVRSPNWLGDAVMAIPAVRALAAGRPDAQITMISPGKIAELWKSVPEVKSILEIAPERSGPFAVASQIRAAGPFDVAILLPNSLRSALEVWIAGVPRRVGFAGHSRSSLLNQIVREPVTEPGPTRPHHSERYLHLARSVGAPEPSSQAAVPRARSGGFLRVGLVPGAEYGPTKRWFPERFAEAAGKIAAARPCRFVLFGVEKDADIGRAIEAELGADHCENRHREDLAGRIDAGAARVRSAAHQRHRHDAPRGLARHPARGDLRLHRSERHRPPFAARPGGAPPGRMQPVLPARVPARPALSQGGDRRRGGGRRAGNAADAMSARPDQAELESRVAAYLRDSLSGGFHERNFRDLACSIHEFQCEHNAPYARYCAALGTTGRVEDWREIPAVPQQAFKHAALRAFPSLKRPRRFTPAAPTGEGPGLHHFRSLSLYEASLRAGWEFAGLPKDRPHFILIPPPAEAPRSSLSHMMGALAEFSSEQVWFARVGGGAMRLDVDAFVDRADSGGRSAGRAGHRSVLSSPLWATWATKAWDCRREASLSKPAAIKGSGRNLSKSDLYASFGTSPRVAGGFDLERIRHDGTQLAMLRARLARAASRAALAARARHRSGIGRGGRLRRDRARCGCIDLANVGSALGVQTQDLARRIDDRRFELARARSGGAAPRLLARGG